MERFRVRILRGIRFDYSLYSEEWDKLQVHIQKLRSLRSLHDGLKYREVALIPHEDSLIYRLREWDNLQNYEKGNSKFEEKFYTPEKLESM
ncbi:hypothetical protein J4414_02430 [Candidatus Woesearchaeota archaeon]|nr:hypothetical protein [Candidatus Woesearchaeota archaeon]